MRIRGLVLAAALLGAACSPAKEVPIEVSVSAPEFLDEVKVEVYANGAPARFLRYDSDIVGKKRVFEARAIVKGERKVYPTLKVRALFGCGWMEKPLRLSQDWPAKEMLAAAETGKPASFDAYTAEPFPARIASVWVDNRTGPDGVLDFGAIKISIPEKKNSFLQLDTCDAPIPVSYDGAAIGDVPGASSGTYDNPVILIEPSGKRCYGRYHVWYGSSNDGGGGRSKTEIWSGRKLYYSEKFIAFAFSKPPGMVMARPGEAPTYEVLEDAKCR